MHKILLTVPAILAFSALPAFAAAQHDVPWYLQHKTERQAEVTACSANPGDLANTPDCINADAASSQAATAAL